MCIKMKLDNYNDLKEVENFLFKFIYEKPFELEITIGDEVFNYETVYNNDAHGLILITQ